MGERALRDHGAKMVRLFKSMDVDSSGALDRGEFMSTLEQPKMKTWFEAMGLQVKDASLLFDMMDDGDGSLTLDELAKVQAHHLCSGSSSSLLRQKFKYRRGG